MLQSPPARTEILVHVGGLRITSSGFNRRNCWNYGTDPTPRQTMTKAIDRIPNHPQPFTLSTAAELLSVYGSPLYVYRLDRLLATISQITRAIPYPQTQFQFASVTNGNVALLQIFKNQGWGIHANTPGDIYLALTAGFTPDRIVYSGSNLDRQEMQQVLAWGIHTLNLDSLSQLEMLADIYSRDPNLKNNGDRWVGRLDVPQGVPNPQSTTCTERSRSIHNPQWHKYAQPRLGLRLNFPPLTGESRIGVRPDEFDRAHLVAQQAGLKLSGIHFYRGTGTNATQAFTDAIDTLLSIGSKLPDWDYLDFGGGFGYPYHHDKAAFDWDEFGRILSERLSQLDRPIDLTIEPGRAAIAGSAVLLARVVAVKWQGKKQIVGVDSTVANLSVPAVHGGYREIYSWQERDELFTTDVCGNTTYSRDYLGRNCQLPRLKIDDIIAVLDVGAYGYAMSSHFLHRPRPAEVLLDNCQHRLIRQREDYRMLLTGQIFEAE